MIMLFQFQTNLNQQTNQLYFKGGINYNNFKHYAMIKPSNPLHHQSHTGFVMILGDSKDQVPTKWQWLTQRNFKEMNKPQQENNYPRLSYSQKKRILSGLETKQRPSSNFKIRDGFSLKQRARMVSTASCASIKADRKPQSFVYLNSKEEQIQIPALNFGVNEEQLLRKMIVAKQQNKNMLGVISVRRLGLRYKLNLAFVQYCDKCKNKHQHELKQISQKIREQLKEFNHSDKELYYFNIKQQPINYYKNIVQTNLKLIVVDSSPKLHFGKDILFRLIQLSKKIEIIFRKLEQIVQSNAPQEESIKEVNQNQSQEYDYQKIKNVKEYVDKLSQNPQFKLKKGNQPNNQLLNWYKQKFVSEQGTTIKENKQSDKNLLFESKCHYPNEIVNRKLLHLASEKVETLPTTTNKHKFIPQRIDLMMEHVRREEPDHNNTKIDYLQFGMTKKDLLVHLDKKNSLLSTQNIPYLIKKYGLNRFQIHGLYNLYKSFEKIALMRSPNKQAMIQVAAKGIDRQTFEVGLKGLDMNPGDQLIKNICHFGDFISWQHFIKIISISLRKTPEQKLTAILKGISSFDDGFLTRHQISLMIGNSLHKLFDKEQVQLKEYFTNMAMTQFGSAQNEKVAVQTLRQKVLTKGSENQNMVSFLILNT